MKRTYVYIDGFNLYYRKLKARPHLKWLNPKRLAEEVLSQENQVVAVKYYTADISGKFDHDAPRRQKKYFDAILSVPEISIHKGMFLTKEKFLGLVHPPVFRPVVDMKTPWPDVVRIVKTEEKGSDVNLASHLLFDAFRDEYDVAVVISNDSDLVEPIRIVTEEMGKTVGLISPVNRPTPELERVSSFVKRIRNKHLENAQFDDEFVSDGKVHTRPTLGK